MVDLELVFYFIDLIKKFIFFGNSVYNIFEMIIMVPKYLNTIKIRDCTETEILIFKL